MGRGARGQAQQGPEKSSSQAQAVGRKERAGEDTIARKPRAGGRAEGSGIGGGVLQLLVAGPVGLSLALGSTAGRTAGGWTQSILPTRAPGPGWAELATGPK